MHLTQATMPHFISMTQGSESVMIAWNCNLYSLTKNCSQFKPKLNYRIHGTGDKFGVVCSPENAILALTLHSRI